MNGHLDKRKDGYERKHEEIENISSLLASGDESASQRIGQSANRPVSESASQRIGKGWQSLLVSLLATAGAAAGTVSYPRVSDPAADVFTSQYKRLATQVETSITVLDGNIVVGFLDSSRSDGAGISPDAQWTAYARSADNGATFASVSGKQFPYTQSGNLGSPTLANDRVSKKIYFACDAADGLSIPLYASTNFGQTFALLNNVFALSGSYGATTPSLAVDNFLGPGQGTIYLAAIQWGGTVANIPEGIVIMKSQNGGQSWQAPLAGALLAPMRDASVPDPASPGVFAPQVVVGSDHSVHVFWLDWSKGTAASDGAFLQIRCRRSTDFGQSFGPVRTVADISGPFVHPAGEFSIPFSTPEGSTSFVNLLKNFQVAASPANPQQLFCAFTGRGQASGDGSDVYVTVSGDGGATWQPRVRINSDSGTRHQFQPSLAIRPDGKRLFVGWYDQRDNVNQLRPYYSVCTVEPFMPSITIGSNQSPTAGGFTPLFNYAAPNGAGIHDGFFGNNGVPPPVSSYPMSVPNYIGHYNGATAEGDTFYWAYSFHAPWNSGQWNNNMADVYLAKVTTPPEIVDLGAWGGQYSEGNWLNNLQAVAGQAQTAYNVWDDQPAQLGFLYRNGSKVQVGSIYPGYEPYMRTFANGVNDFGKVAASYHYNGQLYGAFTWSETSGEQSLNALSVTGAEANAINNAGHTVGYSFNSSGLIRGILWQNGQPYSPVDLQGFQGLVSGTSIAYGINGSGKIVGISINSSGVYHGFLISTLGQTIAFGLNNDIGTMSGLSTHSSEALVINDDGHIVGSSQISDGSTRAFLKSNGSSRNNGFTQLATLGGTTSIARSVNSNRYVVGDSTTSSGLTRGFISFAVPPYAGSGVAPTIHPITDLNNYVGGTGWIIITASGINDNRYVTGWGYKNGIARAFLLGPLPAQP